MNSHIQDYVAATLGQLTVQTLIPLGILVVMFAIIYRTLVLAQRDPDFNISEMFKNADGKVSAGNCVILFCFAMTSWYLAVDRLSSNPNPDMLGYYLLAWSCSPALLKWDGQLPFTKPKA